MEQKLADKINLYSDYLKKKYGKRVIRVGLSMGIPCPHRVENGGCIFCNPETFTDKCFKDTKTIHDQFDSIVPRIMKDWGDVDLLAYFQDETSTAIELNIMKSKIQQAIQYPGVIGLVISTRPDYLSNEVIDLLKSFDIPITIELGLQTIHDKSLEFLNRGHTFQQSKDAIARCANAGFDVGVHLIIGIPGETERDMIETINYINENKVIKQVKFHNLVIYENTRIADIFRKKQFHLLSLEEYIKLLAKLISNLRKEIIITRLFTSNVRRSQISISGFPKTKVVWTNMFRKYLYENKLFQGKNYNNKILIKNSNSF